MPDLAPAPAGLPPLDYIRGRIDVAAAHEQHCGCGTELAQWLEPLIAEIERLRNPEFALPLGRLSPAEERVCRYLRDTDLSLSEIAARLHVGINTVKTQAGCVYRKFGVGSRRDLRQVDAGVAR